MHVLARPVCLGLMVLGLVTLSLARCRARPLADDARHLAWAVEQDAPGSERAFQARIALAFAAGDCPVESLVAGSHLEEALATARRCGTPSQVSRVLVALGRYAEAAEIESSDTRSAAIAHLALGRWTDAARDVELLGHACLGARLRAYGGELVTAPDCAEERAAPATSPVRDIAAWDETRCAAALASAVERARAGDGGPLAELLGSCRLVDARAVVPLLAHVRTARHELAQALRLAWRWPVDDPVEAAEVARYQLAVARALGEDATAWAAIVARQEALADPRVAAALAELGAR